ncbi:RNB domain [seawater metagenome]|uniref:RNB domain n=1 Tax=seawater metagenome TaxID=1561972 RepID=A0A5E8CGX2_9ZZZZ
MNKWYIKKIKNTKTNYDFRLKPSRKNDYSTTNFQLTNKFRILVSLAFHFTKNKILAPGENNTSSFYNIETNGKIPAIFEFSLKKAGHKNYYASLSDDLEDILLTLNHNYVYVSLLCNPKCRIFNSLFDFIEIRNLKQFFFENEIIYKKYKIEKDNDDYTQAKPKEYLLLTGWFRAGNSRKSSNLILDLLKHDYQYKSNNLFRCKILEPGITEYVEKLGRRVNGYCLFLVEIKKNYTMFVKKMSQITFDEYLTYLYDSMLPYKYDLNDKPKNQLDVNYYNESDIERNAFAIDPDGSKDRDDAIGAFYLENGQIVSSLDKASHIKLNVHIADTLDFISPTSNDYYYNFSKYKTTTDYLDKYNLPMMDRMLSEDYLSLNGPNKRAITTSLTYKIIDKKKFIVSNVPEKVETFRSGNLNIIGTTYTKFAESFSLKAENGFSNKNFIKRLILPCNKNITRDFNIFIFEGKYYKKTNKFNPKIEKYLGNNLKQLYIFFVNSLDHTGKDSLLKIPSTLKLDKSSKNIYLDFNPIDMWAHSLVEYTAIETNIYFSHLMSLLHSNKVKLKESKFIFDYKLIRHQIDNYGDYIQNKILNNVINDKKINEKEIGIFRNLYTSEDDHYINLDTQKMILKLAKKNDNKKIVEKLMTFYFKSKNKTEFMRLLLALRQIMLLINVKTNLDISEKLISQGIKMKAKYEAIPIAHCDIASYFYTHSTSPMRRFIDINVHNLIFHQNKRINRYIFDNINFEYTNKKTSDGKQIHNLVNSFRFLEFIKSNKNIIMNIKLINPQRRTIGFVELINFFSFESTFDINKNTKMAMVKINDYDLPILKPVYDKQEKPFNIFFYMLNRESPKIRSKAKKFMEIIFKVKKSKDLCN